MNLKNHKPKLKNLDFSNPGEKRRYNLYVFTTIASTYNFLTRVLSFGRDAAWKKLLLRSLPQLKKPKILDLACGTGDITAGLAHKYPDAKIIGLDLNPSMLGRAKALHPSANIEYQVGDMIRTDFKNSQFDLITGGYALRNAPSLPAAFAEIHRLLKSGGMGAFLDFSKNSVPWIRAISLQLLKIWGSLWGLILHGDPDVYAYIAASLKNYPDRNQLKAMLRQAGFKRIASRLLFLGWIEIITFEK